MSVGKNGRVVTEIGPEPNQQLYETLQAPEIKVKSWLSGQAEELLASHMQIPLTLTADDQPESSVGYNTSAY